MSLIIRIFFLLITLFVLRQTDTRIENCDFSERSLGNEISRFPDFEDGGNPEKINEFLVEMNKKAQGLEPGRIKVGPQNKKRNISIFSNAETVDLLVNGESVGMIKRGLKSFPACGLNWSIIFEEGANNLVGNAYNGSIKVASDTLTVNYTYSKAGKADHISLSYKNLENGNIMIAAIMKDKEGNAVLDYEGWVYFSLDRTGELLFNYSTPTRSKVIEMAHAEAQIEMIHGQGKANIEVRNQEFKGSYLIIDSSIKKMSTTSLKK